MVGMGGTVVSPVGGEGSSSHGTGGPTTLDVILYFLRLASIRQATVLNKQTISKSLFMKLLSLLIMILLLLLMVTLVTIMAGLV